MRFLVVLVSLVLVVYADFTALSNPGSPAKSMLQSAMKQEKQELQGVCPVTACTCNGYGVTYVQTSAQCSTLCSGSYSSSTYTTTTSCSTCLAAPAWTWCNDIQQCIPPSATYSYYSCSSCTQPMSSCTRFFFL
jgi:hypothetical protein